MSDLTLFTPQNFLIDSDPVEMMKTALFCLLFGITSLSCGDERLVWKAIPALPSELGVAGPFVGVHDDVLLVAGGANFPEPVWENDKVWHRKVYGLPLTGKREWKGVGELPQAIGYGASVSVEEGVVCIGGNDAETVFDDVSLLKADGTIEELPSLPEPSCNGAAALVGRSIYFAAGMSSNLLSSASSRFLRLNLDHLETGWERLPQVPAPGLALSALVAQSRGENECLYLIGGRRENASGEILFLADVFEFDPTRESGSWKKVASLPRPLAAGTGVAMGEHHIFMLSGADGSLIAVADELKLDHPGFPGAMFAYDTRTDSWTETEDVPANQVTTQVATWNDRVFLVTGEVKPRVRTKNAWEIRLSPSGLLDVE